MWIWIRSTSNTTPPNGSNIASSFGEVVGGMAYDTDGTSGGELGTGATATMAKAPPVSNPTVATARTIAAILPSFIVLTLRVTARGSACAPEGALPSVKPD